MYKAYMTMSDRNLLFLRNIPTSLSELQAAITQAVLLSSSSITSIKYLDIAVTLPFAPGAISRRQTFGQASNIVNKLYSLAEGINNEIEVNVILLHEDYNDCGGIIRHWSELRRSNEIRRWLSVISIEDVDDLFGPYCKNATHLPIGEFGDSETKWWESRTSELVGRDEHEVSCVGGTFDYLHAGHKLLLTMTAYMIPSYLDKSKIIVGLTGAELLKNKKHKEFVTSWEKRCEGTLSFLRNLVGDHSAVSDTEMQADVQSDLPTSSRIRKFDLNCPVGAAITLEVHEIQDAFGPTISMEEVSCLVVSEETKSGGEMINQKRREKGWKDLEVFTVGLVGGDGTVEGKLSSTEMRRRRAEKI